MSQVGHLPFYRFILCILLMIFSKNILLIFVQHMTHCQCQLIHSKVWICVVHHWLDQRHRTKWTWISVKLEQVNYWIQCHRHQQVTPKQLLGTILICNSVCNQRSAQLSIFILSNYNFYYYLLRKLLLVNQYYFQLVFKSMNNENKLIIGSFVTQIELQFKYILLYFTQNVFHLNIRTYVLRRKNPKIVLFSIFFLKNMAQNCITRTRTNPSTK